MWQPTDRMLCRAQYAQGGFFNVSESSSTSEDSQGTGFSIASYTVSFDSAC